MIIKKKPKKVEKPKAVKKGKIGKMFKKMNGTSELEVTFGNLLTKLGISFEPHFMFKKREFDFLLTDYNILVETHGCFFHCCKKCNCIPKYAFQRRSVKNDIHKIKLVKLDPNYKLLVIWEHELKDKRILIERLNEFIPFKP